MGDNRAQSVRSVEIYNEFIAFTEDPTDSHQDCNPPGDDKLNVTKDTEGNNIEDIRVVYKDIQSPDLGFVRGCKVHRVPNG